MNSLVRKCTFSESRLALGVRSLTSATVHNPHLAAPSYQTTVRVKNGSLTLSKSEHAKIDRFLRINQAGETAAVTIYRGQMAVLGRDPGLKEMLAHMRDQEAEHLRIMDRHVVDFRVRPTVLQPIAAVGGYLLGVTSALLGVRSAMTCTEAVETRIGGHYNDQLRELHVMRHEGLDELKKSIAKCRDEELEHLDTAVENGSQLAPLYRLQFELIKGGCSVAIWLCDRI
ncbi:ubiquinone biosynthesis monooxygenase Coq7 [Coemansia interrupta]|uniref:5-demethoxyubiquinone hydroxylase, mitochondrial n=1 Tax=Coemansia interrupta TaxID=1126814 RepID=A0A9W8LHW6_9FUNG|nr:ubiquinone biosynthesis monooxygenase Coq7 [Coemansia interrupta]